ncbi:MAG: phospholipase D-like domain-containing protein [Nitrospiraceae bacterium]
MIHLTTQTVGSIHLGPSLRHWLQPVCSIWLLLPVMLLAACAKLPPELTLPRLSIAEPAFQNSLAAFTGAPIIGDNKVDILLNGDETFPALVEAIRAARKTVTFETYIFRKSQVADRIIEAFAERCHAGVRVAILLDAHGSSDLPVEYVETLRHAGCHIVPDFRPLRPWKPRRSNMRNHRRIVVVDGRIGFTGGYGVDEAWTGNGRTKGRWRETNVRLEGPIVQQLQAAFLEHWREATGELLGGEEFYPYPPVAVADVPVRAQIVRSSPTRDNYALYDVFLQSISSAQRSILISTPYLLPGEQMIAAFVQAVQRGVSVRVLVPSVIKGSGVEYVTQESQREGFGPLLDAGIELHEYSPALLHTKTMVIDGAWATLGSTNFDNRSMAMNDELNVVFYNEQVAKRLEGIIIEDLAHSRKVDRRQLENRGWYSRLLGIFTSPLHDQF